MKKTIKEKGLLVSLKISKWSAKKSDNSVLAQIEQIIGTKASSGSYHKNLIDLSALSETTSVYNAAKKYHEAVTMPWFDNGYRILPAVKFTEYQSRMREYKNDFNKAVEKILDSYNDEIQKAQIELGPIFRLHEYPLPSEIENLFTFKTAFSPLPEINDFRVDLSVEEIKELKKEMENNNKAAIQNMEKDLFNRLYKSIAAIVEKLQKDSTRYSSLFDNLEELISVLPVLNITDNTELQKAIQTAKNEILAVPSDSLKDDTKQQTAIKEKAENLLETIAEYADCF